jgi:glycosyltransferase involved in cell wall biosynthesis
MSDREARSPPAGATRLRYSILISSGVPVIRKQDDYLTLDLWEMDLRVQAEACELVRLHCPVIPDAPGEWTAMNVLPHEVEVVRAGSREATDFDALFKGINILQVRGGVGWSRSGHDRALVRAARARGLKTIIGISSNRARASLENSMRNGSFNPLRVLKGLWRFLSIRAAERRLTAMCDGAFVVGRGLVRLVAGRCPSVHVSTASWIPAARTRTDRPEMTAQRLRRLCVAARLERMKGIHVAIDGARLLAPGEKWSLLIYGAGPERQALEQQARELGLAHAISFGGTLAYPSPFLDQLAGYGMVLLTNLSDEQPRLVFDAISEGVLPICPDTEVYRELGIPQELLYEQGNGASLGASIARIWGWEASRLASVLARLDYMAREFTLESMHARRAEWISREVLAKRPAAVAATPA